MSGGSAKRNARDRIVAELKRELVGPSAVDETLTEFPTSRYVVGRLAPQNSRISELENDPLGVGEDDEEAGTEDTQPPLTIAFNPSSIGLSFLIDNSSPQLSVEIEWGDYKREQVTGSRAHHWQRYQRTGRVEGLSVSLTGPIPQIKLANKATNPKNIRVSGLNDEAITLEGVVRQIDEYRAVSVFLVNRRTEAGLTDRSKDERWIYQTKLRITSADGNSIFVAKKLNTSVMGLEEEGETAINNLLYRNAREFATGHGVAANWLQPTKHDTHSASVFTEFVPTYEAPQLVPPSDQDAGAILDMQLLAEATDSTTVVGMLEPLVVTYEKWTDSLAQRLNSDPLFENHIMKEAGTDNLNACRQCAKRLRDGLDLISDDDDVFEAFRFANRAMWDQRIHSNWAALNQELGEIQGSVTEHNESRNRTWRPFQIGFILANLTAVAREEHPDRSIVDLLWFPTGGGKTEAYLGLAAFVLASRRLRGDRDGMIAGAGVSIIMRYTLRLLTVQQFQRATALLCACEVIRRERPDRWGEEPFQIGIWVGLRTAPNTFSDSRDALEALRQRKTPRTGSPVQLVSCPRCGTNLTDDWGIPLRDTYLPDERSMRTRVYCPNSLCEFAFGKHNEDGLPVLVVDDEIYRFRPSLVVSTVDKFARMPFKGETQSLFGFRDRYSPTRGHLTPAHGTKPDNRTIRDAIPAARLLPPELIIQDELHLISGPLGTMVGLYETAVDFLSRRNIPDGATIRPKIIASTATIRRAAHQIRQLYSKDLFIFPPSGLEVSDSFFAKELPVNILPVVVPSSATPEQALDNDARWRTVWQMLNAIRSHDERFEGMLNRLALGELGDRISIISFSDWRPPSTPGEDNRVAPDPDADDTVVTPTQHRIVFEGLPEAIRTKIVEKCGNRRYWEDWAGDVAQIASAHIQRIRSIVDSGEAEREIFQEFLTELRDDLNPDVSEADAIEMLAQHMVTKPVVDALFGEAAAARSNTVSQGMQTVLDVLEPAGVDREAENLDAFYESVRRRVEGAATAEARQKIVVELYDKFFRNAFPRMTERLSIVYTPVEIVDFIRECLIFCVSVIWSMLSERSKDYDNFPRTAGRAFEGLRAA